MGGVSDTDDIAPDYAAGLFDGQGFIDISGKHQRLRLTTPHRATAERLKACFGGTVTNHGNHRYGHRASWAWELGSHEELATFLDR